MRAFVAYSHPRGILGRVIFTVMIYYTHKTESIQISVQRGNTTYACGHCGKWATIALEPSVHQQSGVLELFRYDNVEPGDRIRMDLRDTDLLLWQHTELIVSQEPPYQSTNIYQTRPNTSLQQSPKQLYEVIVIDWDTYLDNNRRGLRVEEELIQKTMRAEPIAIKELLLAPAKQTPAIEGARQFIEGELRYVE